MIVVVEMHRISRVLDVFEQWSVRVEAAGGQVECAGQLEQGES